MNYKKHLLLAVVILVNLVLTACGDNNSTSSPQTTDYSIASHWLALPVAPVAAKSVDIFYLYPTAWTSTDPTNPHFAAIDEPSMLAQAPASYARQATAFETVGNVYAPFYRQFNSSAIDRLNNIASLPTLDAVAAFDYYIKHYNKGRPYILVGHSQGATVLVNLLSGYMKQNPTAYQKMVAAYVVGSPVTPSYLAQNPHLKFATGPDDTGVIISYNTEAPGITGTNPVLYDSVGLVINPISWVVNDETPALASASLGSFMPNSTLTVWGSVSNYADATINVARGVLICSSVPSADLPLMHAISSAQGFPDGVYHTFDIPFYYYNLRANAQNRADRFLGVL